MKKQWVLLLPALGLFGLLTMCSAQARAGAMAGLTLWGTLLVPSLLPFFTAAGLLTRLGLPELLGAFLSPLLGRALHISGTGCSLFLLGLSGGYPLGAVSAGELVREGRLSREEGEHLLCFCDTSGPAFAVGALRVGVFGSAAWGLLLWGVHALSALLIGLLLRPPGAPPPSCRRVLPVPSPGAALTGAVAASVSALLNMGGYVVFFSALLALCGEFGFPSRAAEALAALLGTDAAPLRALLSGALELSSGLGAMASLSPTPAALALAAGLLGWGGLCVHWQSAAAIQEAGLRIKGRLWGKLLHGVLSAGLMYAAASLLLRYAPSM